MNVIVVIVVVVLALVLLGPMLALLAWITWDLIVGLLVAMLAGYFAGHIMSGKGYGPLANALLGLGGGVLGNILLNLLSVDVGEGFLARIVTGVVGAVVLVWLGRDVVRR